MKRPLLVALSMLLIPLGLLLGGCADNEVCMHSTTVMHTQYIYNSKGQISGFYQYPLQECDTWATVTPTPALPAPANHG